MQCSLSCSSFFLSLFIRTNFPNKIVILRQCVTFNPKIHLLEDPKRIEGFLRTLVFEATEVLPSENMISQTHKKIPSLVLDTQMTHKH